MKRLTLAEARKEIADRELWLWRQKHWGHTETPDEGERDFCDQDYPGPALEDLFWDVPNQ